MFVARLVDGFQTYVVDLIRAVLRARPEMLTLRRPTVSLEDILRHKNNRGSGAERDRTLGWCAVVRGVCRPADVVRCSGWQTPGHERSLPTARPRTFGTSARPIASLATTCSLAPRSRWRRSSRSERSRGGAPSKRWRYALARPRRRGSRGDSEEAGGLAWADPVPVARAAPAAPPGTVAAGARG